MVYLINGIVRTGQSHRTLTGHTGAINVLQFDETNVVTGSTDKTIRVSHPFLKLKQVLHLTLV